MRIIILIALVFFAGNSLAQMPMLNKNTTIDSLKFLMVISDSIDYEFQNELRSTFNKSIEEYNKLANRQFIVLEDSTQQGDFIHITLGQIKYCSIGRSIWVTFLDLGLLTAYIALAKNGIPPFIYPFLMPATRSPVTLNMSDSIVDEKNKTTGLRVYGNGYFVGIEKQKKRYNKRLAKRLNKLLKNIQKQQLKNKNQ